jgi:chlorite dismutase
VKKKKRNMIMSIEDSIDFIVKTVVEIKSEIIDIKAKIELKAYTLKEIANGLGYSVQTLRNYPWKIPNYGKADEGSNPGKWFYNSIKNWYDIPEEERRFKWESMSSRERREITGRIQKNKEKVENLDLGINFMHKVD